MSKVMQDKRISYLVQDEFEPREQHDAEPNISNIMTANCTVCGEKMQFKEGDVIFGEKWFHKMCSESKTAWQP